MDCFSTMHQITFFTFVIIEDRNMYGYAAFQQSF